MFSSGNLELEHLTPSYVIAPRSPPPQDNHCGWASPWCACALPPPSGRASRGSRWGRRRTPPDPSARVSSICRGPSSCARESTDIRALPDSPLEVVLPLFWVHCAPIPLAVTLASPHFVPATFPPRREVHALFYPQNSITHPFGRLCIIS